MQTEEAVAKFILSRKARSLSPETIRWYSDILRSFAKQFPRLPKKTEEIEGFIAICTAGDERRHGYFRAIRAMYRYLARRYEIFDPTSKLDAPKRKPKLPRPLMPDEIDQLLAYPHPSKIKAALLFLTDTGARVGEASTLTMENIAETPYGHIAKINGKTGSRWVPISYETYVALSKALPFGYSKYRLRRLISFAFRNARVPGSGINLRHSFGTYWEGDIFALQQILGHAHLSTVLIYRQLRTKFISEEHRKYSPLRMVLSSSKSML